jgi:hypothetical protein
MRLRIIAFAAISAMSLVIMTSAANAQRGSGLRNCADGGICPDASCGNNGGRNACKVKNCKASNCRGQVTPDLNRLNEKQR